MNKKAFLISYYVDFYAYLAFILLMTIFYFLLIKDANQPLNFVIEQEKNILDQKLTEINILHNTFLSFTIQEILEKQDSDSIYKYREQLNTLLPTPQKKCIHTIQFEQKNTLEEFELSENEAVKQNKKYYDRYGITLPTTNKQEIKYVIECV